MDQENEQKASEQEASDLWQDIQDVKLDLAVQTATQAGAQATQAAALSGLAMTVGAGFVAFVLGMFLGININKT